MRVHRYPGLFGDPRARGLRWAIGVSLLLHAMLFVAYGRFHIRPVDRIFFAPLHMVDLVDKAPPAPGPKGPGAPPRAVPKPAPQPKAPPEPAPKAAQKAPPPKPAPAVKVPPASTPAPPKPDEAVIPAPKPKPEPKPKPKPEEPAPEPERYSEERVAERIARLRSKIGEPEPSDRPAKTTSAGTGKVESAIDSIRQRLGVGGSQAQEPSGRQAGGAGPARAGGNNVLQQVRLRSYFNQLWDHVQGFWEIPPSLTGRGLVTVVGVQVDAKGAVRDVTVEEGSGSKAFDDAAVRALYRASPFPPPPDEIVREGVGFRLTERGVSRGVR